MASKKPTVETDDKSIQHVRSGHLARLTRLTREIEEAKADPNNASLVIELQRKATVTLERFNVTSQAKSLPADEMKREMDIANKHNEAKNMLDKDIEDWLMEVQRRGPTCSRASSLHSSASQDAERRRRKLELELNQLLRRQNAARKDEEAECLEKQRELERQEKQRRRKVEMSHKQELLDAQDALEAAQLDEELLVSDGNDSELSLGGSVHEQRRSVTFSSNSGSIVNKPPVTMRQYAAQEQNPQQGDTIASGVDKDNSSTNPAPVSNANTGNQMFPPEQSRQDSMPIQNGPISNNQAMSAPSSYAVRSTNTIPIYSNGTYPGNMMQPPMFLQPQPPMNMGNFGNSGANFQAPPGAGMYGGYGFLPPPMHPGYMQSYNTYSMDRLVNSLGEMTTAFRNGSDLPKPELPTFSGDPRDFCKFKLAFITSIESKTCDDSARLYYLIQHCSGKARSAIEHCSMFYDASHGLREAKSILANTFGQRTGVQRPAN